jgi:hypothetical protein
MASYNVDISSNLKLRMALYPKDIRDIEQTEELCLIAVKSNANVLQFVTNQTNAICMEAINQYAPAFKYVIEQTEELCWQALKWDPSLIVLIKEPTEEMAMYAIGRQIHLFYDLPFHTLKLCELAKSKLGVSFKIEKVKDEALQVLLSL